MCPEGVQKSGALTPPSGRYGKSAGSASAASHDHAQRHSGKPQANNAKPIATREKRDIRVLRSIEIDIVIVRGNAGLIHARSRQMRSLMLMGRSEDELWRDMDPVLRDLLDIQGDTVATMTIDRPGRRVRVDVE
jgi:hypothetical protein